MSEQEQLETFDVEEVEPQEEQLTIDLDEDSSTADDSDDTHEQKVTFSPEQQKVVNDLASKKAYEAREANRRANELEKRLKDLEAQKPAEQAPVIPPPPNPYDDDYEAQIAARDRALVAKAQYDANANYQRQQVQQQQYEVQRLEQETLTKTVTDYSVRAQKLGITESELQQAGSLVSQYGINDQVTRHILDDEQGPLITKYLSQNPHAMDTLNSLSPISAGLFIEQNIKPEAIKLKPRTTGAPPPIDTLNGAGVSQSQRGPKGATFT